MLAASVFVSSRVPCLADLEGLVLVSSIASGSYNLSAFSFWGLPELGEEKSDGDLPLRLSLHVMSGCGSLHLFPFAVRGSLSDDK